MCSIVELEFWPLQLPWNMNFGKLNLIDGFCFDLPCVLDQASSFDY